MAKLRNKRKLAAMAIEAQKYPRNNQSPNSAAPGITEDFIAQFSGEIEGSVTEKLSQEFSRTKFRILGALSELVEILLNPQTRTFSGTVPGTFRSADVENQEPSGDHSQNDSHLEVDLSACRASNVTNSDPDKNSHKITAPLLARKSFEFRLFLQKQKMIVFLLLYSHLRGVIKMYDVNHTTTVNLS